MGISAILWSRLQSNLNLRSAEGWCTAPYNPDVETGLQSLEARAQAVWNKLQGKSYWFDCNKDHCSDFS
jgi:hypothetical protein